MRMSLWMVSACSCMYSNLSFFLSWQVKKTTRIIILKSSKKIGLLKHHQHLSNSINKRKGGSASAKFGESSSAEEEFFCLTPEDARSISSNTGSDRSRNASATSHQVIPDTKIFSVAVETMKEPVSGGHSGVDSMVVCDVDTDYTGRFAVVSSEKQTSTIIKKQLSRHRENKIEADEAVEQVVKVMKSQVLKNSHTHCSKS